MGQLWQMESDRSAVRSDGLRVASKRVGAPYSLEASDGRPISTQKSSELRLFLTALNEARSVPLGPDCYDWARRQRALTKLQQACFG